MYISISCGRVYVIIVSGNPELIALLIFSVSTEIFLSAIFTTWKQSKTYFKNLGLILNSSRAILFADNTTNNFDKVARSVAEKTLQEIRLAQK